MALKYAKLVPANLPENLLEHGWDFRTQLQSDQGQKAVLGAKIRLVSGRLPGHTSCFG
ncbi:hypothetical protein [Ruegeria profundi]|uniref:hypothetical protein n=1 Tax=Ruegeria profundi TaxID=1685378 RepID=UPI001CD28E32|nr:hypothetical protein [Ruegeria profundi]MCA0930422.1 hypothetical protein [Ruegeria profundi]